MFNLPLHRVPSIRTRLMALVLACILPASLLAVVLIYDNYRQTYQSFVSSAMATARANAAEVDKDFSLIESALQAFSTSPHFDLRTLPQLDGQAHQLVAKLPVFNLVLEDDSGQQVLNTALPFGQALPRASASQSLQFMKTHQRRYISPLFSGPVSGRQIVAIGIPIRNQAGDWLALSATLPVERYAEMLRAQHYPQHWLVSLRDQTGQLIAYNHPASAQVSLPKQYPQSQQFLDGTCETRTQDGQSVLMVRAHAPVSGWVIAIGIPLDQLKAGMRRSMLSLVLATFGLLGLGLLSAWRIGTKIHRAMDGLIGPAQALGSNQLVAPVSLGVREADQVGAAMVKAAAMLNQAQHQANHDGLTGLANRSMFYSILEKQLAAAECGLASLTVLYLDLDQFKPINDNHGHAVGDQLLIAVATRLTAQLRKTDLAARLGGDEFAVVLASDATEASMVVSKLVDSMAQPYQLQGLTLYCAASIGMASYPQQGNSISTLLAAADQAMYAAKAARSPSARAS